MPKISIIVPVYKVEQYLRRCLDSIINQTFSDWECVLVDDGSPDNSGKICDEYAVRDKRFKVIHKKNEGVAKARIRAFENSTGELITFIDSDDYVSELYLEKLSNPIIECNADIVSCDYCIVENGNKRNPKAKLTGTFENQEQIINFINEHYFYSWSNRSYGMTCFLWTKMVKREFVSDSLKESMDMWFGEDQVSILSMMQKCKKMVLIPDRLYFYIMHDNQAVKKYNISVWDNIVILLTKYKSFDKNNINKGIRFRTWLHLYKTVCKMILVFDNSASFANEMKQVLNIMVIKDFFKPMTIGGFGTKNEIKYQLLKYGFYRVYYYLIKHSLNKKR